MLYNELLFYISVLWGDHIILTESMQGDYCSTEEHQGIGLGYFGEASRCQLVVLNHTATFDDFESLARAQIALNRELSYPKLRPQLVSFDFTTSIMVYCSISRSVDRISSPYRRLLNMSSMISRQNNRVNHGLFMVSMRNSAEQ